MCVCENAHMCICMCVPLYINVCGKSIGGTRKEGHDLMSKEWFLICGSRSTWG